MKYRLPIVIFAAVALVGLWAVLIWLPLTRELKVTHARISAAEVEIADYNSTIAQLPSLLAAKEALDKQKRAQRSSLYAKADILKLFDRLKSEARANGLSVTSITPPVEELLQLNRSVQTSSDPVFLNITIKLRGVYFDFTHFMLSLEQAPYFRGVTACRIVDEDGSPDRLHCLVGFRALLGHSEETS